MFQPNLREACPEISRSRHLRNRSSRDRDGVVWCEDHPILARLKRGVFPVKAQKGQPQAYDAKVFTNTHCRKAAKEICLELSTRPCMPNCRSFEFQTESSLTRADAGVARVCRRSK